MLRTAIVMDAQLVLVVVYVESYFVLFTVTDIGVDFGVFRDWSQPGLRESVWWSMTEGM